MPKRALLRQPKGPPRPCTPGRMRSLGIRQSWKTSSLVMLALRLCLPCISGAVKPGSPFSTMKPRMTPSTLAHAMATSAMVPLVIHILAPLRTQLSPSSTARVISPPGFEPKSGSVRPKQPIRSPAAMPGRYFCFWASVPYFQMGNMARLPCTLTKLRMPLSPRSSSWQMRP